MRAKHKVPKGPSLRKKNVNKSPSNLGNVTPPEQLIEDDPNEFDETGNTYVEAYLSKVQTTTEPNHPGLYASFIQLLHDAGENSELRIGELKILHGKVKHLFKDYPELLAEFELFLNAALPTVPENPVGAGSSTNVAAVDEVTFVEKLRKYTKNAPQIRAKILNKCKSLKEANPGVTEKELARALEPFFLGNPVMMAAFKDVIPLAYQFLSVSGDTDFEMVELDMEESPKDNHDDLQFEVLKLPEETAVPATNTCPCVCHTTTKDAALSSKFKHCSKCALKFQDGKIYYHKGRVMRPVSVELTPAPAKSSSSLTSVTNRSTGTHDARLKKDSGHQCPTKPKEFKEPEIKQPDKKRKAHHPHQMGNPDDDWTEEEDTIILMTCQEEPNLEIAWRKMARKMPQRGLEQIKARYLELIDLIKSAQEGFEYVTGI